MRLGSSREKGRGRGDQMRKTETQKQFLHVDMTRPSQQDVLLRCPLQDISTQTKWIPKQMKVENVARYFQMSTT
jgi:hypothetical protein